MTSTMQRDQDGTLTLTVNIPWIKVEKELEVQIEESVKNTTLKGFRKGKAPKKMVEEGLDKAKIREDVLRKILPQAYVAAIEEQGINPVIRPSIHIEKVEDGKDWIFTAATCEVPQIQLNNYKIKVSEVAAKDKIILPGKEPKQPKFEDIMKALLDTVTINVPKILINQEVDRLMAQVIDDVRKLGLNLDQYLTSTGKTPESLRADYEQKALEDIKFEFALQKVAEEEKITVEEKEIDEAIKKTKDDKERVQMESNKYLLASILRQQKTLDFLKNL